MPLRIIIDKTLTLNKAIIIAFVDVGKLFDNIDLNIMFKAPRNVNVNYRGRRVILQLFKNERVFINRDGLKAKTSKVIIRYLEGFEWGAREEP